MNNGLRLFGMFHGSLPRVRRHSGPDGMFQQGLEFLDKTTLIPFYPIIYPLTPITPVIYVPWVLFFGNGHVGNLRGHFFNHDKGRGAELEAAFDALLAD